MQGVITGQGSVVVEHQLVMEPLSVELATDEETELAIFAGGDVVFRIFRPELYDGESEEGEEGESDSGPSEEPELVEVTTVVRGLIYAGNDVIFEGQGDALKVEGALVAPKGKVDLQGLSELHMIYNPNYVDIVLDEPGDSGVEVETVSWREL